MKQYSIVLNVPDDFVPEELDIKANYGDSPDLISIADEGFIEDDSYADADISEDTVNRIKDMLDNDVKLGVDVVPENSVVRVEFTKEFSEQPHFFQDITALMQYIESRYKVPCVCYLNDLDVLVDDADDAVKMFNGMIAKIKTRAAVKDTSGIVLPN